MISSICSSGIVGKLVGIMVPVGFAEGAGDGRRRGDGNDVATSSSATTTLSMLWKSSR